MDPATKSLQKINIPSASSLLSTLSPLFSALEFSIYHLRLKNSNQQFFAFIGELLCYYSAENRYYHTIQHILELFSHFENYHKCHPELSSTEIVVVYLTIIFHDIIYVPTSKTNEIDSNNLFLSSIFASFKTNTDIGPNIIQRVSHIILATQHHSNPIDISECKSLSNDEYHHYNILCIFLDMDLAIFGSTPQRYREYSSQIQKEYSHLNKLTFCNGRRQFLQKCLKILQEENQTPKLFRTEYFSKLLTEKSIDNLKWEISMLSEMMNDVKS